MTQITKKFRSSFQLMSFSAVAAFALFTLSGCGRNCELAKETILNPTQEVTKYLRTQPSGRDLESAGCSFILDQMKNYPAGAATIRKIAENQFSHVNSRCIDWNWGTRWVCTGAPIPPPYPPYRNYPMPAPNCYPETYQYCAQWEYDTVRDPSYAVAMELSTQIDQGFALANDMCGDAAAGLYDRAYGKSRELLSQLVGHVDPAGRQVYGAACGK